MPNGTAPTDPCCSTGEAAVPTFHLTELIATKVRALYQRKKGRDLCDLRLAVRHAGLAPDDIAACFAPYRPESWSAGRALENLEAKLNDAQFRPRSRRSGR